MYCVRNVTSDLYWVGANDHRPVSYTHLAIPIRVRLIEG